MKKYQHEGVNPYIYKVPTDFSKGDLVGFRHAALFGRHNGVVKEVRDSTPGETPSYLVLFHTKKGNISCMSGWYGQKNLVRRK